MKRSLLIATAVGAIMSAATIATRELMAERAVQNLIAGLRRESLPHIANPEVRPRST